MSETIWTHAETCAVFAGGRCNCRSYGVSLAVANESPTSPLAEELTRLRAEVARLNEERVTVRRLAELMSETCTHFPAALDDWGAGAMLGWANALHAVLFPAPATDTREAPICTSCGLRKEKCDGC